MRIKLALAALTTLSVLTVSSVPATAKESTLPVDVQTATDQFFTDAAEQRLNAIATPAPDRGAQNKFHQTGSASMAPLSSGPANFKTWNVGSGTTAIPSGAWYFNNGYSFSGSAVASSSWDSANNKCMAYATTSVIYGRADAWCVLGNQFTYNPAAPAGTLVPVNIQVQGVIRGEVASAGDGNSSIKLSFNVYDVTTSSQYASYTINLWNGPAAGWTQAIATYNNTYSYQLVSGHQYIAYVGVDTAVSSADIAYVVSDVSPSGPSGLTNKGATMTQMTFISN